MEENRNIPFLLWPFWALFQMALWILKFTGRLIGAILGLVMLIVGVILTMTIVGAIIGIPLILLGGMLMWKSIFG
ncbi:MAG: hypothetical protein AAGU15_07230 [Anaerolineaceae bacterium]